jgi:hypothetical protein
MDARLNSAFSPSENHDVIGIRALEDDNVWMVVLL